MKLKEHLGCGYFFRNNCGQDFHSYIIPLLALSIVSLQIMGRSTFFVDPVRIVIPPYDKDLNEFVPLRWIALLSRPSSFSPRGTLCLPPAGYAPAPRSCFLLYSQCTRPILNLQQKQQFKIFYTMNIQQ